MPLGPKLQDRLEQHPAQLASDRTPCR